MCYNCAQSVFLIFVKYKIFQAKNLNMYFHKHPTVYCKLQIKRTYLLLNRLTNRLKKPRTLTCVIAQCVYKDNNCLKFKWDHYRLENKL